MKPEFKKIIQQGAIVSHVKRLYLSGDDFEEIREAVKDLNSCFANPLNYREVDSIYKLVIGELVKDAPREKLSYS